MQCYVYKGNKKEDHFLYLPAEFDADSPPDAVPQGLLDILGDMLFVIEFNLVETRDLPNADAKQVITALTERGFYVQVPKESMYDDEERYFN